ncbi:butanol dehydrogenase, partial [Pseudomonas aeruginosa]|nr:butanol dehydrogenase [Pseudomonas aeruginosa]
YMGIPAALKDLGIVEKEFKEKLPEVAKNAVEDACTGSNPRAIDAPSMEKLLACVYYGQDVDF